MVGSKSKDHKPLYHSFKFPMHCDHAWRNDSLSKSAQIVLSNKEVQIVYRMFLVNCYLLHVPRLPSQPASNMGGWVIDWNWLGLAWQSIAMTKNNLCIISISLLSKSIFLVKSLKIWSFETIQRFPMHVHVPPYIYKAKIACPKTDDKEVFCQKCKEATITSLIIGHARLFVSRNKFHPTL